MIDVETFDILFRRAWRKKRRWWVDEEDAYQTAYLACLTSGVDLSSPAHLSYLASAIHWSLSAAHLLRRKEGRHILSPMQDSVDPLCPGVVTAPTRLDADWDDWIDGPAAEASQIIAADPVLQATLVDGKLISELAAAEGVTRQAISARRKTAIRRAARRLRSLFRCLPQTDTLSHLPSKSVNGSTGFSRARMRRRFRQSLRAALYCSAS